MSDSIIWLGILLVVALVLADAFDAARGKNRGISALAIIVAIIVALLTFAN